MASGLPENRDNEQQRKTKESCPPENQEVRKDAVWNRWVIFSTARGIRPSDFKTESSINPNPNNQQQSCPFCTSEENGCAPDVFRVPPPHDNPNWKIRVIQNLYPALSRHFPEAVLPASCSVLKGFGFHDVVIETPEHSVQLSDLSAEEIGLVFVAYTERIKQIACHDSIKYVQVFKNHGASAGASMSHSHSQILALPFIPPRVSACLGSMRDYYDRTGKCCLCEIQRENLLIDSSTNFFSLAPYAAAFPYEIWIVPNSRNHSAHFHKLDADKANELGSLLKLTLMKISKKLNNPPFNFMVHTSPLHGPELVYSHWFIQIVPHVITLAGFEIATECHINPVFPEDAAKDLREVNVSV